jgi:large conductance mechanosensitive channel
VLRELREFAIKGSVMDMAVGIIIGAAFTSVVTSLVSDILMPPIGLVTGGLDFSEQFFVLSEGRGSAPYDTLAQARASGATVIAYGLFVNSLLAFSIVSLVLFLAVRWMNRLRRPDTPAAPNTDVCSFCMSTITSGASRCPFCTSVLDAPDAQGPATA